MIKITYKKDNNLIKEVTISGHALYASYGQDIVCSAVSSIITTTINDIIVLDKDAINYVAKDGNVQILNNDNQIANKLLEVMLNTLIDLAHDYPKNIKIGG